MVLNDPIDDGSEVLDLVRLSEINSNNGEAFDPGEQFGVHLLDDFFSTEEVQGSDVFRYDDFGWVSVLAEVNQADFVDGGGGHRASGIGVEDSCGARVVG